VGVFRDQGFELTDQVGMAAERQIGFDPFFDRREA
jgi:hypothetical protein